MGRPYMLEDHSALERQANGERPLELPTNDQPQVVAPGDTTECFIGWTPSVDAVTSPAHTNTVQYMLEN